MSTEITGRNFEVTPKIKSMIEKKLSKIEERLFDDVIDVRVVLRVEKYRNSCEILIHGKEHDVKAAQESDEGMTEAIDRALDHVKRQAQKNREKIRDHRGRTGAGEAVTQWAVQVLEPGNLRHRDDHNARRIIKTSNLPILLMSIEDAALKLDGDAKNDFIVFRDSDTEKINVMYRRRDNNLGLIAPEI
jgi:putative sigma-54 modulation protein